jgi:hypothetical protein
MLKAIKQFFGKMGVDKAAVMIQLQKPHRP